MENNWTDPLEELLVTWAEKSSGYAWLHQKSATIYKKRNLFISIPAAILGYMSGITVLLSKDIIGNEDAIGSSIMRGFIGVIGITAGVLSNFQEMFTFKEEAEKHRIAALRFLSFFREISCELSLESRFRSAPIDYITIKRFEFDKILEQSPDIPAIIIKEFNATFRTLSIHKPDPVTGLQTILPYGKELKLKNRYINLNDKILLLKCFTDWKMKTRLNKYKKYGNTEHLIEIANSRNSNNEDEVYENTIKNNLYNNNFFEENRLFYNKNIKIKFDHSLTETQKTQEIDEIQDISNNQVIGL